MKKLFEEFKAFALKGNVMDMAVGVIIGASFQAIVTALTGDFITPLIQALTGKAAEDGGVAIGGQFVINGAVFNYGDFISAIVNFLIMAIILFILVKFVNGLMNAGSKLKKKKEEEPAAPTTKICPFCKSEINIEATKCPCCTSDQPKEN